MFLVSVRQFRRSEKSNVSIRPIFRDGMLALIAQRSTATKLARLVAVSCGLLAATDALQRRMLLAWTFVLAIANPSLLESASNNWMQRSGIHAV
jgi:hypothetical protein